MTLSERLLLLSAIFDSAEDAIIAESATGMIEAWNPGATMLYGYSAEEAIGRHASMLSPPGDPYDSARIFEQLQKGERIGPREALRRRKDGGVVEVSLVVSPIRDPLGEVVGASVIARDVTAARATERALKETLKEKEVLIREIHHRVKNNLQVISSLLNLQANRTDDPKAAALLRESQRRMRSISLFHEKVYQSKDLSRIDMGEYLRNLTAHIQSTYHPRSREVEAVVDVECVLLGVDAAIPCGLLANELISNCFAHAFPGAGERGARVTIRLRRDDSAAQLELIVEDNGVGFPADLDFRAAKSLGLELVTTLCEQLGGTLEMKRGEPGTHFRLRFAAPA